MFLNYLILKLLAVILSHSTHYPSLHQSHLHKQTNTKSTPFIFFFSFLKWCEELDLFYLVNIFHFCHWRAIWGTIPFIALLSLNFPVTPLIEKLWHCRTFDFAFALAIYLELAQDLRCQKVPWVSEWIWYFNRGCFSLPHLLCISSYCNRSHRWWGFIYVLKVLMFLYLLLSILIFYSAGSTLPLAAVAADFPAFAFIHL